MSGLAVDVRVEVSVNGQVYRFAGQREWPTAVDGYLNAWVTNCPTCGAEFEALIPGPFKHNAITRRCPEHRQPGIRVKRQGKQP